MATTASGIVIPGNAPTTTPAVPIQDLWNNLGKSLNGRIVVPVASVTARAALVTALTAEGYTISASKPLYTDRADAPPGLELEVTRNGTTWKTLLPPAAAWTFTRPGVTDAYTPSGSFVSLLPLTITAAPAGKYTIDATLTLQSSGTLTGYIECKATSGTTTTNLTPSARADVTITALPSHWTWLYTHTGGDLVIGVSHTVSSGTVTVFNPSSNLVVQYVGA